MKDPVGLGYPAGPFHSWSHLVHYVDQFLLANIEWTKSISTKWEVCRSMEIRIIAVQDESAPRNVTKSVLDTLGRVFIGPPIAPPNYTHVPYTQTYIGKHNNGKDVRDIGLDNYNDEDWRTSGGMTQNMLPDACPSTSQRLFGIICTDDYELNWSRSTSSSSHREGNDTELTHCSCYDGGNCDVCLAWSPDTREAMMNLTVEDEEQEDSMMSLR